MDFLASTVTTRAGDWKLTALEINLRMGGTSRPYLALQFLTGGSLDPATGLFLFPSGHAKYYKATDNLFSEQYQGLLPEDLVDVLTMNKLHYSHGADSGVLSHLIGALFEFGKLGLTAIANSPAQVDDLFAHTLEVLDRETTYPLGWTALPCAHTSSVQHLEGVGVQALSTCAGLFAIAVSPSLRTRRAPMRWKRTPIRAVAVV